MRGFLKSILFVLLFVPRAGLAQYTGVAAFAAMNPAFPCDQLFRILDHSPAPATAVLWNTFGEDRSCMVRFMDRYRNRPHLLQIIFSNEACRRNRNCKDGELAGNLSVDSYNRALQVYDFFVYLEIQKRLLDILMFTSLNANDNTTLMLSLGLEDNFDRVAYEHLSGYVHAPYHWPHIVNRNPLKNRGYRYGDFYEAHGGRARCYFGGPNIVNEDGDNQSVRESRDFMRSNKSCFVRLLWRKAHQGRETLVARYPVPPRKRTFKISDRDVVELGKLLAEES